MKNDEAELIFTALEDASVKGKGLLALSNETGLGYTQLKKIVQTNSNYFVKVDASSYYRINPFSQFRGETALMLEAVKQRNQKNEAASKTTKRISSMFVILLLISLFTYNAISDGRIIKNIVLILNL